MNGEFEDETSDDAEFPQRDVIICAVCDDDTIVTRKLAINGELRIGRSPDSDLCLPSPLASRNHAIVRLSAASGLQVRDLGSANGTLVGTTPIEPNAWVNIQVGEPFSVAGALLVAQPLRRTGAPQRISGVSTFERRVRDQLVTNTRSGDEFGVCTLRLAGNADRLLVVLSALLGPQDVIGSLSDSSVGLILVGRSSERIRLLVDGLEAHLERRGARPEAHVAIFPADGSTVEGLLPSVPPPAPTGATTVPPAFEDAHSPEMQPVYAGVKNIAPTSTSVLILGATGTGKDVLAHAIHDASLRASGPFVALNCAALPEHLLESELFGYERGAFTGANSAKPGQFELADGGTLFLDEIGDMPLAAQGKLLRAIQERSVMRLGGVKPYPVDIRLIAATHQDLPAMIAAGRFRADLYYRVNGYCFTLPLLRDRIDSIVPLALHFVARAAASLERRVPIVEPEVFDVLMRYSWPGNIRELRSVIERAVVLSSSGVLRVDHLPESVVHPEPAPSQAGPRLNISKADVLIALKRSGGNQTEAAKILGISRGTLVARIDEYGIARPRKGK